MLAPTTRSSFLTSFSDPQQARPKPENDTLKANSQKHDIHFQFYVLLCANKSSLVYLPLSLQKAALQLELRAEGWRYEGR